MLLIKEEMHRRPCLIIVKAEYKGKKYDFAVPFRSNISNSTPKSDYFSLPPRRTTKPNHAHGLHYAKMFPITSKYFLKYNMGGDVREELVLAIVEKRIKEISDAVQQYLHNYEMGVYMNYHVDIDNVIKKLKSEH